MGAVSPAKWVSQDLLDRIKLEIFDRTLAGLEADGIDFRGVLYAGVMVDGTGTPVMLEYNCRFGDPETQSVLPRLRDDLGEILKGAADGALPPGDLAWTDSTSVCVVLASAGYPGKASTGFAIAGLAAVDAEVFHAGTTLLDGALVTAGGRVLSIVTQANDLAAARRDAYRAVEQVRFEGMQYRRDIGERGKR